jgi:hypothetical protein
MAEDRTEEAKAPEEGKAKPQETTREDSPQTIEIGGKEFPIDEVLEWKDAGLRQADYTKKTMALAEEKREWQSKIEASDARIAQLEAALSAPQKDPKNPYAPLDDYVPGLSEPLAEIRQELKELRSAQEKAETEAAEYMRTADAEEAIDAALAKYQEQPFANLQEMKSFMQERNLGPDQVDLVYARLYGEKRGEAIKEAAMRKRNADAPAPMGASRVGIPGSSAEEIAAATSSGKPIQETSWQELRDRALADPRRSQFNLD